MSYPDFPSNRVIVNGTDLTNAFRMVLVDGFTLSPPAPKTYLVDIPGGNGKLDLTDSLIGDTVYDNRSQVFTFKLIDVGDDFEEQKTTITNFLHGKEFDYVLSWDPEYTYHGRFNIDTYTRESFMQGIVGTIQITVDAEPYKRKEDQIFKIDAIGGTMIYLNSGRMRVRPVIETTGLLTVIFKDKLVSLPQGTWSISDVLLTEGINELYLNSYPIHNLKWGDLRSNNVTWKAFKEKRIFEWYKSNGDGTYVVKTWGDLENETYSDHATTKWSDLTYKSKEIETVDNIYIKYEWRDL